MRRATPAFFLSLLLIACGEPERANPLALAAPISAAREALAAPCVVPQEFVGTEDLNYSTDGYPGLRFRPPSSAYPNDAARALAFLQGAVPTQMTSEPFDHPDVALNGGWLYNNNTSHRGLDYSRSNVPVGADPTFAVRAMADGVVRKVIALNPNSPRGGNVVIIEHTVPGKPSTFSLYMHLRNGKTADQAAVQTIAATCPGYALWALQNPNHITWGTDAQAIMVSAGDTVQRGQQIAWAGNTGCNAAGLVIDSRGSTSSATVNTHLHVYYAAEDPTLTFTQGGASVRVGVMIDPYGVYERESTSCYDTPRSGVLFPRHLMPYPPDFHGLDYAILSNHLDYYPGMGMALQTISLSRSGSTVYAMGSFQRGLSSNWRAALWYTGADFDSLNASYANTQNLRTREVSVAIASDGTPRYSAIWTPLGAGETYILHRSLTQSGFDLDWQTLVGGGYRVDDYFEYEVNGQRRISAGFTSYFGSGFKLYTGLSHLDELVRIATEQSQGWRPVHLNIAEPTWRRALLFRPSSQCWIAQSALSASGYQSFYDDVVGGRGYRLYQVENYDADSTFAAVATRAMVNGACP